MAAAQGQNGVGSADGPEHARPFQAGTDHRLAARFDDARAHKEVLAAKLGIAHALCVLLKVVRFAADLLGDFGRVGLDQAQGAHQLFDLALIQQALLVNVHPSFLLRRIQWEEPAGHFPKMLASVVEIDNLNRAWKVFGDQVPNPIGSVAVSYIAISW